MIKKFSLLWNAGGIWAFWWSNSTIQYFSSQPLHMFSAVISWHIIWSHKVLPLQTLRPHTNNPLLTLLLPVGWSHNYYSLQGALSIERKHSCLWADMTDARTASPGVSCLRPTHFSWQPCILEVIITLWYKSAILHYSVKQKKSK